MKYLPILLVVAAMAGCTESSETDGPTPTFDEPECMDGSGTLYLGPEHGIYEVPQEAGRTPGNGFAAAFLTNDMDEWVFPAMNFSYALVGNMNLTYWTQGNNMPAPIIIGGDPGEGYHFFNQFGTNRGFIESYAIQYASTLPNTDVVQYVETYQMPEGGLIVENGDHLRLLLTNLVADGINGKGPDILWGGDRPSSLDITWTCLPEMNWTIGSQESTPFSVPFHHGLLTGAVPDQEGLNHAIVPFNLHNTTGRLTIEMMQTGGPNPIKDDMDISVLNAAGEQVWSIGSPYTDEIGTRWTPQLDAHMPPGAYDIRINSYSGHAYEGRITVTQEIQA